MNDKQLEAMHESFSEFYSFAYDNPDALGASYDQLIDIGDYLIKSDKDTLSAFVHKRGDFIASDRETASYAFAYVSSIQTIM